jgi:hypothetical protein
MILTQVPAPFHWDGWVYEEKVDGWRILAYKDAGRVQFCWASHSERPTLSASPRTAKGAYNRPTAGAANAAHE